MGSSLMMSSTVVLEMEVLYDSDSSMEKFVIAFADFRIALRGESHEAHLRSRKHQRRCFHSGPKFVGKTTDVARDFSCLTY